MHSVALNLFGHGEAIIYFKSALEAVAHVGFHHHGHVGACGLHHLVEAHVHEAHAVLERAAETVAAAVGVGRQELRYKVAVAGMHLHTVETGVAGCVHGVAETTGYHLEFVGTQSAAESGRIEIEAGGGTYGCAAGSGPVGHVAAVAYLNRGLGALGVYVVGDAAQVIHYFGAQPELGGERQGRAAHSGIRQSGHAHAAFGHRHMIVVEHVGGVIVFSHPLEGCRADSAVAQFYGA